MSLNIPLQLNGTPIQDLGPEFVKTAEIDRSRGLILPTIRDNVDFNNFYTTEYISGVYNQDVILENNYNPEEELDMTDAQARAELAGDASLDRPISAEEKEVQLYTDNDLDPRLRQEVVTESQLNGSNLDFSESQDFVREIQESVKAYTDEQNLYISLVPFTQQRATVGQDFFDTDLEFPIGSAFDVIQQSVDELEKARQAELKERLRFIERPIAPKGEPKRGQPPQEEKLKPETKKTPRVEIKIPKTKDEL
jgi:hypothetical protein